MGIPHLWAMHILHHRRNSSCCEPSDQILVTTSLENSLVAGAEATLGNCVPSALLILGSWTGSETSVKTQFFVLAQNSPKVTFCDRWNCGTQSSPVSCPPSLNLGISTRQLGWTPFCRQFLWKDVGFWFNDSLLQVGGKVIVCGGQPLSSRLSCLLLEANSPASGGQINPQDPTSSSINSHTISEWQPHAVLPSPHSGGFAQVLDHVPNTWITLLMPGSCTWVTHLTLGSHTWTNSSHLDQITNVSLQVNGAKLTLLGGSLNPQGVLEVLLYDFDNRAGLHLNTRLGLTGQWWKLPLYQYPLWLPVLPPCQVRSPSTNFIDEILMEKTGGGFIVAGGAGNPLPLDSVVRYWVSKGFYLVSILPVSRHLIYSN